MNETRPWAILAIVALFAAFICTLAFAAVDQQLLKTWSPLEPNVPSPLVFAHDRMTHARDAWRLVRMVFAFWSASYFAVLIGSYGAILPLRISARAIVLLQACSLGILIFAPLPLDSDQFAYAGYANLVLAHQNPYVPPKSPPDAGAALRRVESHWGNPIVADRYGPAFTAGAAIVLAPFANAGVELQARVLRVAASVAALFTSALIWLIFGANRLRLVLLAAFALNPLILVEAGLNGHNEMYLVLFAILAYYLAAQGRFFAAAFALATATAIKFSTAPFILVLSSFTYFRTRNIVATASVAFAFVTTLAVFAAPFGIKHAFLEPLLYIHGSTPQFAYYLWRTSVRLTHVSQLPVAPFTYAIPIAVALSLVAIAWLALRGRRSRIAETIAVVAIFLAAQKIEPWYAILLTPLLLVPGRLPLAIFSGGTLAALTLVESTFDGTFPYQIFYLSWAAVATIVWGSLRVVDWPSVTAPSYDARHR